MEPRPCPWLLEPAGSIDAARRRVVARCAADPARPELSLAVRAERCLIGGPCSVRVEREGALGALAATLAPNQPIGDPQILSAVAAAPASRRGGALRRLLLVGVLAVLVALGSGPAVNLLGTILGGADGDAAASLSPSPDLTPGASESATPSPSTTPSASPESPSPSPSASPSPSVSAGSGKTYVVQRGDTLYQIGIDLNIKGGYKALAALNGISGPGYTIVPGQILKLP